MKYPYDKIFGLVKNRQRLQDAALRREYRII